MSESTTRKKIAVVMGTRPEITKLAPVVEAIRADGAFDLVVCNTAQHRQMVDQILSDYRLTPDVDLDLMSHGQTLPGFFSRAVAALDGFLSDFRPSVVMVQGDTRTVLAAALSAFYHQVPVAHVEAGLRSFRRYEPFPEEMNRVLTSQLTTYHFAPTVGARDNLLRAGADANQIFVTGNTVIDSIRSVADRLGQGELGSERPAEDAPYERYGRLVLITGHRRENFGQGFLNICEALRTLSSRFPDVAFVYPVHLNPQVRKPVMSILDGLRNVFLLEPMSYFPFVALMQRSTLILTDSGGIQEEAPSLGKPVLVMRDVTERPEAVQAGVAALVGTDTERIVSETSRLLTSAEAYGSMVAARNPFGDGQAALRIVDVLRSRLLGSPRRTTDYVAG